MQFSANAGFIKLTDCIYFATGIFISGWSDFEIIIIVIITLQVWNNPSKKYQIYLSTTQNLCQSMRRFESSFLVWDKCKILLRTFVFLSFCSFVLYFWPICNFVFLYFWPICIYLADRAGWWSVAKLDTSNKLQKASFQTTCFHNIILNFFMFLELNFYTL